LLMEYYPSLKASVITVEKVIECSTFYGSLYPRHALILFNKVVC